MDQTLANNATSSLADSYNAKQNASRFFITVNGLPNDTFTFLKYESENYALTQD